MISVPFSTRFSSPIIGSERRHVRVEPNSPAIDVPDQRTAFVELLAAKLNGRHEIGDGQLHRLCAELQRKLFDPPDLGSMRAVPRHEPRAYAINGGTARSNNVRP
jgi:hypothetical protein